MRVFVGWSGSASEVVANALRSWLPFMFHNAIGLWMSEEDITSGSRWSKEIAESLEKARFGIFCVTPENLFSPWLLFEAGALSKAVEKTETKVVPFLLNITYEELPGPLQQFQVIEATREDVLKLVKDLNEALVKNKIDDNIIEVTFDLLWERLDDQLKYAATLIGSGDRTVSQRIDAIIELLNDQQQKQGRLDASDVKGIKQNLNENPEETYLFDAARYGVGHRLAEFNCFVSPDGKAEVVRQVSVESFQDNPYLDSFLIFPGGSGDGDAGDLRVTELKCWDADGEREVHMEKSSSDIGGPSQMLRFTPPLEFGDNVTHRMKEASGEPVFAVRREQLPEGLEHEFFGWTVKRPARELVVGVTFPADLAPEYFYEEVRRADSRTGLPLGIEFRQESEIERIKGTAAKSDLDEEGLVRIAMTIDRPVMGFVYMLRWLPPD